MIAILAFLQLPASAQFASGSIGATVTDASGAVVPQAKVTLKNEATGALRDTVTNNAGYFDFPSILPASYTVTVIASGLQTFEEQGIVLTQGATLRLPTIILQVQSTKQEVQVVAGADVIVPVDSGQSSQTLNKNMIENISLSGRDAAELIKIMPGASMVSGLGQSMWGQGSVPTQSNNGPIGNFSVQGNALYGGMTMTSDGANLLDPGNQGTQTANINQNQVQEVSVLTSAFGAEFAKGPITFQAIGKSGGTQFHGQAYLYARNGVFNSNGWYNNSQGLQAPTNSFYYPGGDFGGPVLLPWTHFNRKHDKLFFYAAYEYMDQHPAGNLEQYFVPTAQMLGGNFSPAYLTSLGKGFNSAEQVVASHLNSTLFPGGIIPSNQIDPNSMAILKLMPQPNVDPVGNPTGANYETFLNPPVNRYELRLRGDYNISDSTKLFFSWNHQIEHDQNPLSIWWNLNGSLPYPSSQNANQDSNTYSANLVHVFSPTLTNEFIFAEATFLNPIILGNPSAVSPSGIGFSMTGLFSNPYTAQMPNTYGYAGQSQGAVGFGTYSYGEPFSPASTNGFGKLSQTPQISDNVTKIQGAHTLKAGVYWDYARNYQTSGSLNSGTQGAANFDPWGSSVNSGNYLANFISGRINGFSQDNAEAVQDMKYTQFSFFINDQWKASRRLTLTGGLRFEHMGNWVPNDKYGVAVWDPAAYNNTSAAPAWTGLQWHSIDSSIPLSGFPNKPFFVEPRFGFAYDLFGDGKTVLRGGAGLYRFQIAYNNASSGYNQPLGLESVSINNSQCCVGWNEFQAHSNALGLPGLGTTIGALTMGDEATPNTWTYNFTVSQRAPWRSVAEFQYAGSRSRDLLSTGGNSNGPGSIDFAPLGAYFGPDPLTGKTLYNPGTLLPSNFPNLNDFLPYHNYTGITLVGHLSYSNYNAFIATWQKQAGRFTFTTNYSFSKNLGIRDGQTSNGNGDGQDIYPFSLKGNYGVLAYDRTHVFNAAYIVNLPTPVHGNRLLGGVVNGWVLSGITQAQSGPPLQPLTGGTLNVSYPTSMSPANYLGTNAPLATGVQVICDPRNNLKSGQFFNPACFAPPTGGSDGTTIWPYIKGPAFFNSDLAIYKDFLFGEHQKVEFRMSAFNFLNHPLPQFGISGNSDINLSFVAPNASSCGNNPAPCGLSQTNLNTVTTGTPLYKNSVPRVIEFAVKYNF
ncbi:MAG TPA: carboxypeptidase regulatory-like domain-containing protein [Bryobacteraceae bacterium]|nr:carboxypeptidase regulatory-like domain-containing protein [Bryobacteraceae bacterium]